MYKATKVSSKKLRGAGDDSLFYDVEELEVLREELLTTYSTPRENIVSRDQITETKRIEFAHREAERRTSDKREHKDEETLLKIRAKQDALKRLYENVILENTNKEEHKKKHRKKRHEERKSSGSFHQMYTVFHDPVSGKAAKMIVGSDEELIVLPDDESTERGAANEPIMAPIKVITTTKPTVPPSKIDETDKMSETSSAKERSKFVLKKRLSSLKSKPPPLYEEMKLRMQTKRDARYSEEKGRYSFDVDVAGPFLHYVDPEKPRPKMRTVATQALMIDEIDVRKSGDNGSQTDVEVASGSGWGDKRTSKDTNRSKQYEEFDGEGEEEEFPESEEMAGGDASSSNPSEMEEEASEGGEEEEYEDPKKSLVRKDSRRRDAETMARPRGYRDLDLGEPLPLVTFEAETHVSGHDLDREEGKRRGITITRDNVLWPSCSEFDMDLASKRIEDYIKRCWTIDPKWLFVIHPLEVYHDNYRKKYIFEVKFSIPSPTTPVPPATASVFFVFEIPIYSMKDDEVQVSYVLEGTRFPHQPGRIPFQDKWLWGIISDKLRIQKAVNF